MKPQHRPPPTLMDRAEMAVSESRAFKPPIVLRDSPLAGKVWTCPVCRREKSALNRRIVRRTAVCRQCAPLVESCAS